MDVDHTLAALQRWSAKGADAPLLDFIPITEGATLLGAERLIAALDETSSPAGSSPLNPFQVAKLEEELQLVRKALSDQIG